MAIQTTSINDLMQLINAMSAGSRQKTIEQNNLIKDFSFGIEGIFDDKKLADKNKNWKKRVQKIQRWKQKLKKMWKNPQVSVKDEKRLKKCTDKSKN